ncbi:ubiquitin-related domain-containing protein [Pyrenochaeta sp. MPI-SDFR-AT-0127]|nr:ubiquitin-related domain-containing protein [Pyrenochaeta sp. MPI-SDFR-AT-0127]
MAGDLDTLIDMGFPSDRAELAVKATGGLQGAIDWLEKNQDKSIDEIKAEQSAASASDEAPSLKPGEEAKSLVCEDCGRKLRSTAQAEWHASKTGHENFAESTEEIAPLTAEEKKQKLEDLKAKLASKRAAQSEQDKEDKKKNEQIRLKATKESQDIREELQKKERLKEAQAKRAEKKADEDARKRVLAKLEADKQERKRKAEAEKAARAGQAPPPQPVQSPLATSSGPTTSKPASAYTEARLALQGPGGRITKTFPVETTLFEVAHALEQDGVQVNTFTTNFPKKTYDKSDFGMTLKEAGLVPSAALIIG